MTNEQIEILDDLSYCRNWNRICLETIRSCSELIESICMRQEKWEGSLLSESAESEERTAIIESIAGVEISLEQMKYTISARYEVAEAIEKQMNELKEKYCKSE